MRCRNRRRTSSHPTRRALAVAALATLVVAAGPASGRDDDPGERGAWIAAWGTSQQALGAAQLTNATVRMIARVTIPGDAVRIRLDNTYGTSAVVIGTAYVGQRIQGADLAVGSNRPVFFGGSPSVVIPAGGSVVSDPVSLDVYAQQDLAVSLYVPGTAVSPSQHSGAVVTSYLTRNGDGDTASIEARTPFTLTTTSTWWLKGIDVHSTSSSGAIVAFGDSITDGTCTTLDAHDRWEDWVAVRLDSADAAGTIGTGRSNRRGLKAIVNEGIGGNTVTRANLSPPPDSAPGIERLDRDVLSHVGVTHVVLFMGTNDIRREASAAQVIDGMSNIIGRVKAAGLKIIGVTIIPRHNRPPAGTNTGWNDAKTAIRNEVNRWIRTQAPFDAVIDFDEVVRDPANHDLIFPPFNCGDGIHPSPAGYYTMGQSVDVRLLDDLGRR
jgi:lysophospholipase L1-like esterase